MPAQRERVQKILAAAGVASRRAAEGLIRAGRVTVNGERVALGATADPLRDVVSLDGEPVQAEASVYWVLHKPAGILSTTRDPQQRRTVLDLLPHSGERLFPVGRLDRDTRGLLLVTNDGPWAHALLHPSHQVEREYAVVVRGRVTRDSVRRMTRGIVLEGRRTAPAGVEGLQVRADGTESRFRLTLIEGRKRQIRSVCAALGHRVLRLTRVRMGPLRLGGLAEGAARPLTRREHAALARLVARADARDGNSHASARPNARPDARPDARLAEPSSEPGKESPVVS